MANSLWPIIYVRGYAATQGEIDATTADPFCGFNLGSTVFRATPDKQKPPQKFVFESPVVRLGKDFGYESVYDAGADLSDPDWTKKSIPAQSIVIYRYYDEASTLLGSGKTPPIERFAADLGKLILRVRELVCADAQARIKPKDFRVYLVAHSMGGLVCRTFLQNSSIGDPAAKKCVDKVFTYGTPHNGIEVAGFNVPGIAPFDATNFNRDRMAKYLGLGKPRNERVDWLPEEAFPSERFFCMIGTNRADYEAFASLSRTFVGHGSDGLVRIANASVWGFDAKGKLSAPCATAYAYRAHSGTFGLVNSEETYQNLVRFLFGDIRVDMWLDVDQVRVPGPVEAALQGKKKVEALYQFEVLASPRGKRWYLTRRVAEEDSVACRTLEQLRGGGAGDKSIYLSTLFLSRAQRVNPKRESLAYAVTIGVRVPDYEIENRFWKDEHYEGGYLFRDTAIVEVVPPKRAGGDWKVVHSWQSRLGERKDLPLKPRSLDAGVEIDLPFEAPGAPGITARLRLLAKPWNS